MQPTYFIKYKFKRLSFLILLSALPVTTYAIDPKFALDPKLLDKKTGIQSRQSLPKSIEQPPQNRQKSSHYRVKQGDNLLKVLAREYGVTGNRAEALIPEIKRLNNMSAMGKLPVGSTILIPLDGHGIKHAAISRHKTAGKRVRKSASLANDSLVSIHQLRMMNLVKASDANSLDVVKNVWSRLVPPDSVGTGSFDFTSAAFSLSLDPDKYPVFSAADGGKILVDGARSLPPLVTSLIQEKTPGIRIVAEDPGNRKLFFKSLLASAGFYSVEDNFTVEFGSDPKITVNADFKIEKNPESLLHQDITLLNVGENQRKLPEHLLSFLEKKGFRVIEASPLNSGGVVEDHVLWQILASEPNRIADSLLQALSLPYDSGKSIELYAAKDSGIKLDVRADRYFENDGRSFVVSIFNGDPINYTLMRLLETKGYRVIMLEAGDDLQKVSDKFISQLHIVGGFGKHDLWSIRNAGYGVQLTGVMIHGKKNVGKNIFITDRKIDPLLKDLAGANGYSLVIN